MRRAGSSWRQAALRDLKSALKSGPFEFSAAERVILPNALIGVRFFDLPTRHASHARATLGADGRVQLLDIRTSDGNANTVCVAAAAFEKCVFYGSDALPELDRIARQLYDQAARLTGKP